MSFLGRHDFGVKGVLLDRSLATESIITLINSYAHGQSTWA